MILKRSILVLPLLLALALAKVRFDNHQVYRVLPQTDEDIELLKAVQGDASEEIVFWNDISIPGRPVDVMVSPSVNHNFKDLLTENHLEHSLMIKNVQENIDNERPKLRTNRGATIDWEDYYTLDEINAWLAGLEKKYPQVTLVNGGTTYEGRNITGVKVSFSPENENNAVYIEGNIHAREWITSAVATYILNELLTSENSEVRALAETHDWYIFPVINPDGFVYTHTTNRVWRKTRTPYGNGCYGADPNRNWGYHWNEGGTTNNPCDETYRGPSAFSEKSQKTLSQYLETIGEKLVASISFHSYAQLLLIPYGFSADHVENYDDLKRIGDIAAKNLSSYYGTEYEVGNIVETIYIASGGSGDWIKGTFHTPITYTYELRDQGRYGFVLPADQIIPTSIETFSSVITIFKEFAKKKMGLF